MIASPAESSQRNRHAPPPPEHLAPSVWAILLFLGLMLSPFQLHELLSVLVISEPYQAIIFGTVFPRISALDVAAMAAAVILLVKRQGKLQRADSLFFLYVALSGLALLGQSGIVAGGLVSNFYWDGAIEVFRLSVLYFLFVGLTDRTEVLWQLLIGSLAGAVGISIVLYALGYQAEYMVSFETPRMNIVGYEVTSASHMAGLLVLAGLFVESGLRRWACVLIGVSGLFITGGRIAGVVCLLTVFVGAFIRARGRIRLVFALGIGVCAAATAAQFAPGLLEGLPLTTRALEIVRGQIGSSAPVDLVYFGALLSPTGQAYESQIGRVKAMDSGLVVLREFLGVPLGSDWQIQEQLVGVGYPSHTHNTYLQTLLRLGVPAVALWLAWGIWLCRGIRSGSSHAILCVFLLLGWLGDYWFFVTKPTFVAFALFGIMRRSLAEGSAETEAQRPAGADPRSVLAARHAAALPRPALQAAGAPNESPRSPDRHAPLVRAMTAKEPAGPARHPGGWRPSRPTTAPADDASRVASDEGDPRGRPVAGAAVAAIVLHFRRADDTVRCVESLLAQDYPGLEILVVDNDPSDGSGDRVRTAFRRRNGVTVVSSADSPGYARGNNFGARWWLSRRRAEYLLFSNDDVVYEATNVVSALVAYARSQPNLAGVQPMVRLPTGYLQGPYPRPSIVLDTAEYLFPLIKLVRSELRQQRLRRLAHPGECFRVVGACFLANATCFQAVGMFDESTFLGREEDILAEKCWRAGWRFHYHPGVAVLHRSLPAHGTAADHAWRRARFHEADRYYYERVRNVSRGLLLAHEFGYRVYSRWYVGAQRWYERRRRYPTAAWIKDRE